MRRDVKKETDGRKTASKQGRRSNGSKRNVRTKANNNRLEVKADVEGLDTSRGNNPAWYFTDEKLADQVSQLSFQQLAGLPVDYDNMNFDVANIVRIMLNPCPGVQLSNTYNTRLVQNSAINMAGFRLYSKLSAYTGRTQSYAPQDISTMILAFGEVISIVEHIRRAFGVSYTMNMRNRSYPIEVLQFGMLIDASDLFANLSDYRTQFNTLITLINQLPIPKNIAYFDKCAALYERIYLDAPSSMAQTIIPVPYTTWILDEQSYSGGTILATQDFCGKKVPSTIDEIKGVVHPMSYYLNILATMIGALLNSSTLQIVYTDILNYASKVSGTEFWKFDYLFEEYQVIPEFDLNFMLQFHNMTFTSAPIVQTALATGTANVTPFNDVYPDVNHNSVYYNPAFSTLGTVENGLPRTGNVALIDMLNDTPNVTDRVEVTRFVSICKGTRYVPTGQTKKVAWIDCALPDHYAVQMVLLTETSNLNFNYFTSTINGTDTYPDSAALLSTIDWAPHMFECTSNGLNYTGRYVGDLNYYTTVDSIYMRKLHDFVGLALYDLR